MHSDWIVPDWPAPPSVRAICTTRHGGVSRPPYDSLNLGDHVGDDAQSVSQNRGVLKQSLRTRPVFLQQVHGTGVVTLGPDTADATEADACIAIRPGVACTIMVADCLPILLTDRTGTAVAAAHAGWRGLAGANGTGVIENVVTAFRAAARPPSAPVGAPTIAWIGPCIGPGAFEVGDEVKHAFVAGDPHAAAMFQPRSQGKWLADLQGLARRRLTALGVTQVYGNDGSDAWCTVANPSRFFSHRRDRVGGRFAACVWLS